MPERLVEILVPEALAERVQGLVAESDLKWSWMQTSSGATVFKLLAAVERVEALLDLLEPHLKSSESARILVLPVEAISPRTVPETPPEDPTLPAPEKAPPPGRISRSELYEDLEDFAKITPTFLITTALATIVAAIGLTQDNAAVIIGAMVIAPLLGPNMALALATTLGDMQLAARALKANATGFALTLGVALIAGLIWPMNLAANEVASRTVVSFNEILLALATGTAGALAVTTGVSSSLVGVMVAVALLPPLVIASTLLVQGHGHQAASAFLLLATNVICVNLSGVVTFYAQGIKPRTWWEAKKSKRATRIALTIWISLLLVIIGLITAIAFGVEDGPLP